MTRARGAGALGVLAVLALLVCGCSGQPHTAGATSAAPGIRVVSPDGPVTRGDEVRLIVEVSGPKGPIAGEKVTFDVVSGPGDYPGGFDADVTDEAGVATSLQLHARSAGDVVVRIAAGDRSERATITIR